VVADAGPDLEQPLARLRGEDAPEVARREAGMREIEDRPHRLRHRRRVEAAPAPGQHAGGHRDDEPHRAFDGIAAHERAHDTAQGEHAHEERPVLTPQPRDRGLRRGHGAGLSTA
jgi:hypothetical protein